MATMESLLCSAPGTLELVQIPMATRAAGEVLVRPRRIGVCGTDYHIFEGNHPFLAYPTIMGHALAVEVVESGDSGLQVGEIMVVNPYLSCGECIACRRGRPNCCTRTQGRAAYPFHQRPAKFAAQPDICNPIQHCDGVLPQVRRVVLRSCYKVI